MSKSRVVTRQIEGYVPTPTHLVQRMLDRAFGLRSLSSESTSSLREKWLLDPGAGDGNIACGVLEWCRSRGITPPKLHCVELDSHRAESLKRRLTSSISVTSSSDEFSSSWIVDTADFLQESSAIREEGYDWVVANPPYVNVARMDETLRRRLRERYASAAGRFDLYMAFIEESVKRLRRDGGVGVFVTPDGYLTLDAGRALRRWLCGDEACCRIVEVERLNPQTFSGVSVRPVMTVIVRTSSPSFESPSPSCDCVGIKVPLDGSPWSIARHHDSEGATAFIATTIVAATIKLGDLCCRVSCGPITGADDVFVVPRQRAVDCGMVPYAPMADIDGDPMWVSATVSGQELSLLPQMAEDLGSLCRRVMVVPYDRQSRLVGEEKLESSVRMILRLDDSAVRERLARREAVRRNHRELHAFNETPRIDLLRRPKILCKRIGKREQWRFWFDAHGTVVPRHSVFYLVPRDGIDPMDLWRRLEASLTLIATWIAEHAATAEGGYFSLQRSVLVLAPLLPV